MEKKTFFASQSKFNPKIDKIFRLVPRVEPSTMNIKEKIREVMDTVQESDSVEEIKEELISRVDSSWVFSPSFAQTQLANIIFALRALVYSDRFFYGNQKEDLKKWLKLTMSFMELSPAHLYVIEKDPMQFISYYHNNFIDLDAECEAEYQASQEFQDGCQKQMESLLHDHNDDSMKGKLVTAQSFVAAPPTSAMDDPIKRFKINE